MTHSDVIAAQAPGMVSDAQVPTAEGDHRPSSLKRASMTSTNATAPHAKARRVMGAGRALMTDMWTVFIVFYVGCAARANHDCNQPCCNQPTDNPPI